MEMDERGKANSGLLTAMVENRKREGDFRPRGLMGQEAGFPSRLTREVRVGKRGSPVVALRPLVDSPLNCGHLGQKMLLKTR